MINLVSPEGQKAARREYVLRVLSTFLFLFGFVFFFLAASLTPTYILTSAQIQNFNTEVKKDTDKLETAKDIEKEVLLTRDILIQLKTATSTMGMSTIVNEIEKFAPEGIIFKAFSAVETKEQITSVQVQGISSNRETLVAFKSALESSALFQKADVPIADLVRESNLPFTITLSIEAKK